MKRFIAILLAMVMVLGLGTMAMAAAPNEKVQINNMMVDSSLVEAKTDAQAVVEEPAEQAVHVVQTTSTQATLYPPINSITVAGCASSSMDVYTLDDDSNIYYKIYTHGTTIASGANTFTIKLSNGTSFVGTVRITDVDNSGNYIDLDKNQSGNITLNVAADGKARFTASWRVFQNLGRTVTCVVEFDTTDSISLYKNGTDLGASVTNVEGVSVVDKDLLRAALRDMVVSSRFRHQQRLMISTFGLSWKAAALRQRLAARHRRLSAVTAKRLRLKPLTLRTRKIL